MIILMVLVMIASLLEGSIWNTPSPYKHKMKILSEAHVQNAIHAKLEKRFDPDIWHVINVSNEHNQTEGAETYFKILVVCREFRGMPMEKRHELVTKTLAKEIKKGVLGLNIETKTIQEWKEEHE